MPDQSARTAARREKIAIDTNGSVQFTGVPAATGTPTTQITGGGSASMTFVTNRGIRFSQFGAALGTSGGNSATITVSRNNSAITTVSGATSTSVTQTGNTPASGGVVTWTFNFNCTAGTMTGSVTTLSRESRTVL